MSPQLLVCTRKGLFHLSPRSDGWGVAGLHFVGARSVAALADPRDGAWYVALEHGHFGAKLHRSRDRGRTWDEVAAPTYPKRPDDWPPPGAPPPMDPKTDTSEWALRLAWVLEPALDGDAGALWCGTVPGGLFRSDDAGESWYINEPLWLDPRRNEWFGGGMDWPGIHSVCVDPRDHRRVLVGCSCGGVWMSEDGGASWSLRANGMRADYMPAERAGDPNVQDPHRLVQCGAAPDRLWVQHHNGIWRSDDLGVSWHEVGAEGDRRPPSTFGFAVAVHPTDPDTAWFIPAINDEVRVPVDGRLVVTRTRDGGRSFETITEGLPDAASYDLVFRHALDVAPDGRTLAFGSTTGGVWTTDDGGDRWRVLAERLPPIAAIRFVDG